MGTDAVAGQGEKFAVLEVFSGNDDKPSSQIYRNLNSDAVFGQIISKKSLSYRELLLIVTVVVGALDKELSEHRKAAAVSNRIAIFANTPVIKLSGHTEEASDKSAEATKEEAQFFLKYLTLRNILGALVLVLSLAAGFFAWWNQDYRSILDARKIRVDELQQLVESQVGKLADKDVKISHLERELETANQNISQVEGRLAGSEDQAKRLQSSLEQLRENNGAQTAAVQNFETLNEELVKAQRDRDIYSQAAAEWQAKYTELSSRISEKDALITQKDVQLSRRDSEVRDAVDAWNQLLTYLFSKSTSNKTEVRTDYLNDQLVILSEYTSRVPNMKQALR